MTDHSFFCLTFHRNILVMIYEYRTRAVFSLFKSSREIERDSLKVKKETHRQHFYLRYLSCHERQRLDMKSTDYVIK